ncbi:17991_t:CDS:2 [Dentiscutata erythropus]|uniref:17991_t:CDS:1 n=1 Tax=Dentiscutata erythropus TaxID=1348616 RepID=A0A9N8YSS1_9GLOM|nr:17991_t:CDS:2 [Dentiscutata erythropus]
MADAQETKLKYRRGTCLSYRKCLYCGIDLQYQKCNCNLLDIPYKDNQTTATKKHKAISSSVKPIAISGSIITTTNSFSEIESYDLTVLDSNTIEFEEKVE